MRTLAVALLTTAVGLAACHSYVPVVVCRARGEAVICKRGYVPRDYLSEAEVPDSEDRPESSDLRLPYDDGAGPRPTDPVKLIGQRLGIELTDGSEIWAKLVGVEDEGVVLNHRGRLWRYPPEDIALLRRLHD